MNNTGTDPLVGKQDNGSSHASIKYMARKALGFLADQPIDVLADIGAGMGDSSRWLWDNVRSGYLVDYEPQTGDIPPNLQYLAADLNGPWPINERSVSLLISLEVIEHLENPRHFFREMHRVLNDGGYAFVSTPYNLNLTARLLFALKGQHRHFQDFSYPAHITPLLPVDFRRMATETGFYIHSVHYNYYDIWPILKKKVGLRHRLFSNAIGFLMQKL
jgi:SAM-dependent methyltransferase